MSDIHRHESWAPIVLEDGQTDVAIRVHMRVLGHCRGDKLAGRSLHWISVRERHEKYELFTGVKSSSGACDSPCPINAARGNELNTVNWVGNNFFLFFFKTSCAYISRSRHRRHTKCIFEV